MYNPAAEVLVTKYFPDTVMIPKGTLVCFVSGISTHYGNNHWLTFKKGELLILLEDCNQPKFLYQSVGFCSVLSSKGVVKVLADSFRRVP